MNWPIDTYIDSRLTELSGNLSDMVESLSGLNTILYVLVLLQVAQLIAILLVAVRIKSNQSK